MMCISMMTSCFYLSMYKDIKQQQRIGVTDTVICKRCSSQQFAISKIYSSFWSSAIYSSVKPDQLLFLFRGGVISGYEGKQFTHSVYRFVKVIVINIMAVMTIQVVSMIVLGAVVLGMHIRLLITIIISWSHVSVTTTTIAT